MAAYAALVSIMQTIHQIEHHPSPPISMDKKQVESLTHIVMFLQEFLEGYKSPFADSNEPDPLEMRIADAACAAEDAIESHIVDQILAAGSFGLSDSAIVCDDLSREIRAMDYIISVKGELLRQVGSSTSAGLFKTEVGLIEAKVIQDMDLIVAIKGWLQRQVSTSADLYEGLVKVIEHMDFIKKEVQHIIVLNHKLMRLVIKSPGLYKSFVKEIGNMTFSSVLKDELQGQVSTSADLYESVVQMVEGMHLFMKEVKEIVALKDQLLRLVGFSTLKDLDNSMVKMKEHMVDMDLTEKEVMEIVVKDRLQRQVSVSAKLHESLQKVIEEMDLIKKQVTEIVAVKDQRQVSESGGSSKSSKMLRNNSLTSSLSRVMKSTSMVGFDDIMLQLMERLIYGEPGRHVIPVVGMGGIGKTTLAKNVYAHPSISHHFDIYAWVTISQQYNTKELLCEILSQADKQGLSQMSEEDEIVALHKCLTHRRYLVVLDDMWSIEAWNVIQRYLPDNRNGSRIVVTTRLSNLGSQLDNGNGLEMKLMNEESSWNVFCKIVFCGKSCPSELEKIGKKIVKCCRGLPLSIVVMGGLV